MFQIRLKELREKKGISQRELAKMLGFSQGTVGNWESGIRKPTYKTLYKIADLFNVSVDYLMGNTDAPNGFMVPDLKTIPPLTKEEQEEINRLNAELEVERREKDSIKKAPSEKPEVTDEDIQFALFGGKVTDEAYEDVKRFAQFIKEKYKDKE